MKLIIAIIQPHRLEDVKKALYSADVNLITVSEVLGHGREKSVDEIEEVEGLDLSQHHERAYTVLD